MKKHLLFLVFMAIVTTYLNAEVFRINSDSEAMAPYTSIDDAISVASVSDTLMIEGTHTNYGIYSINEQYAFLGSGYFNDVWQRQYNRYDTRFNDLTITTDNVYLTGIKIDDDFTIDSDSVEVKRIRVVDRLDIQTGSDNYSVMQSWLDELYINSSYSGNISNSRIFRYQHSGTGGTSVTNCVIETAYLSTQTTFKNCIFTDENLDSNTDFTNTTSMTILNTVFACAPFAGFDAAEYNNQFNVDMSTVFVSDQQADAVYLLASGSPAIGAGIDGIDCGMFGGNTLYSIGGIPHETPSTMLLIERDILNSSELDVQIELKSE